jgi:7,8-dihydroneopterin aldolase/epimerase/oxygenase
MRDRVFIEQLAVEAHIGVHDWEQAIRQPLFIDVEIATCTRQAAATDNLAFALDYFTLSERLRTRAQTARFQLLETLAEQLAEDLLEHFHLPWVRLRLHKPGALAGVRTLGIQIERGALP